MRYIIREIGEINKLIMSPELKNHCISLLLIDGGINAAVEQKVEKQARVRTREILDYIFRRTILFDKIIENIFITDISNGHTGSHVHGKGYSGGCIHHTLRELLKFGLITRTYSVKERVMLYGLHIPRVLGTAAKWWLEHKIKLPDALAPCAELLRPFYGVFEFMRDKKAVSLSCVRFEIARILKNSSLEREGTTPEEVNEHGGQGTGGADGEEWVMAGAGKLLKDHEEATEAHGAKAAEAEGR